MMTIDKDDDNNDDMILCTIECLHLENVMNWKVSYACNIPQ